MTRPLPPTAADYAALDDTALVARVRQGDRNAFGDVLRRCNQRLFRVARGVLRDESEAEDVVQEAYVHAFARLAHFRGDASLLTWLTRIVLNEAYGRLRKRRPQVAVEHIEEIQMGQGQVLPFPGQAGNDDPAAILARDQARRLLEQAIDRLPEAFRIVFVLREIEDCSVEETAAALGLRGETVKTRLHRARRMLRADLHEVLAATLTGTFPFLGARCERISAAVMKRLDALP